MVDPNNDPRVFFAAERTLLAWVRTGIGLIGLGFVVARFGLFLNLVRGELPSEHDHSSASLYGVLFIALGAAGIVGAAYQFVRFERALPETEKPKDYHLGVTVTYSLVLALLGSALAVFLFMQVS